MSIEIKAGLTLQEAMNQRIEDFSNVNVQVWAKPDNFDGSQARFSLESAAVIGLDCPEGFELVWELIPIQLNRRIQTEAEILEMIHSWYRVPAGMTNPYGQ